MPELFSLAAEAQTPKELTGRLNAHLAHRYQRWAQVEHDQQHAQQAEALLQEAERYATADAALKQELNDLRARWASQ